jgi:hypothetical protein
MQPGQTVGEMAKEALSRQASTHARRTGQSLAEARVVVLQTPAGRQLEDLCEGDLTNTRRRATGKLTSYLSA